MCVYKNRRILSVWLCIKHSELVLSITHTHTDLDQVTPWLIKHNQVRIQVTSRLNKQSGEINGERG